tara:strand:+ start:4071 stop:4640 length:570 start_codon:yes stop_codon:yes gene_type:complete
MNSSTGSNYTIGIFDFPIYHRTLLNWEEKKDQLLELRSKYLRHIKVENIITDYRSTNNYSEKVYEILRKDVNSFYNEFRLENYFIRNSWIEVAEKNMDHKIHNHGATGFSAVVYMDYNPKYHTPTHFLSPFGDFETGTSRVFVPPKIAEGSIIIFPSMLNHFTIPNDSDVPRTILSFNMSKKPEHLYSN